MATSPKLKALQIAQEVKEHQALVEKQRVEEIFQLRKQALEQAQKQHDIIHAELVSLRTEQRLRAVQAGDSCSIQALYLYEKRRLMEFERVLKEFKLREKEFRVAEARYQTISDELVKVRIEQKKVDRVLDKKDRERRQLEEALSEVEIDEQSVKRREPD